MNQISQLFVKPTIFYVLELIGNFRISGQHICLRFTSRSLIKRIVLEFTIKISFNKTLYHKETSQLICIANQLTLFYITRFFTESYFQADYYFNLEFLDIGNAVQKFILRYVFPPRINHVIKSFMRGWNSRPLRSERNWTPEQLWANGMMHLRNSYVTHVAEVQGSINSETLEDLEWSGMDWYAPTPSDEGLSTTEVLDVDVPFNDHVFQNLTANVNPLQHSQSHEIDIFIDAMNLVSN